MNRIIRALIATLLLGAACIVHAQAGKTTRILVGFPPGQATDLVARLIAERLGQATGSTFIVENQPGQGGSIVLSRLAKSPADGSFITMSALAAYVVNPYLYKNVAYDSVKDFDAIALVADLPLALVVHPSVPANTVKELVDYARANPDRLSHSSSGNGTLSHLLMEDWKQRAGVRILHVPYQGSPRAIGDLVAGVVQVGLDTATVTLPQVKAGKLKLIASGARRRLADFPDRPTLAESGFPGFEAVAWIALAAPAGTPREWRERINAEVQKALADPEFAARMNGMGALPRGGSVEDFAGFLKSEQQRWKGVVERSGVKLD
ncbi:MAG: tripartite tricarboxylate transporter substrate binding protein [Burkholderiales bacterium]|nr:tripartite tricarboxylate transporter substrate binding protein [Burkholderiales bacterium]